MEIKEKIESKKTYLGIEFGSTRIKAVLIDEKGTPVASGDTQWMMYGTAFRIATKNLRRM